MCLTKCPDCRRLTFVAATSCPSCEKEFQPGALRAKAEAEEKTFKRKCAAPFIIALLSLLVVLLFVVLRDYRSGTGAFHASAVMSADYLSAFEIECQTFE